ncbi:MAG: LamG-like jellyroll fold domain-containing protein [bacterium]
MTKQADTRQDAASDPALLRNLLAWYAFDGTLTDSHADHDATTVVGAPGYGPDRAGGAAGALLLAGETGMEMSGIEIANTAFTVQMWTLNPSQWILCQGIQEDFFGLHIGANDIGVRCDYWGSQQIVPHLAQGGWTHWVIRQELPSGRRTIWRNGACSAPMTTAPYQGTGTFTLGRHFKGAGFYSGSLDDLAIWDRALPDAEIATLYAGGNGLTYRQKSA